MYKYCCYTGKILIVVYVYNCYRESSLTLVRIRLLMILTDSSLISDTNNIFDCKRLIFSWYAVNFLMSKSMIGLSQEML